MERLTALWTELARRTDYERGPRARARLGLEGVAAVLSRLGDPHRGAPAIHVAGSKGKGSTCHFLDKGLRAAGYRSGLYTSPHLCDWRERIQVGGAPAPDGLLADALEEVLRATSGQETFFDLMTAAAFRVFGAAGCDAWVVEVGLGGRLDSTNVLRPLAAAVTSIEAEHVDVLGDDLAGIAREKGGIFKPGARLWSAVAADQPAAMALRRCAAEVGEELRELPEPVLGRCDLPHPQPHMQRNYALARAILADLGGRFPGAAAALDELPPEELAIPGRWERARAPDGRAVVFDVAHTPQSIAAAVAAFRSEFPRERRGVVLALLHDKDATAVAAALGRRPAGERWWTVPAGDHPQSADPRELAPCFGAEPLGAPALPPGPGALLVTGSNYLVGFLRRGAVLAGAPAAAALLAP